MATRQIEQSNEKKFERGSGQVARTVTLGEGTWCEAYPSTRPDLPAEKDFFVSRLSKHAIDGSERPKKRLTYIDLFCGGGGLSLGVNQAARFLNRAPKLLAAADIDKIALQLVEKQFRPLISRPKSVEDLLRYDVDLSGNYSDFVVEPEITDSQISQFKGKVDLLVGGPPCQGHSNLNNKTRRFDQRNLLYFVMPAFAVALKIPYVIIENVPSINQAREDVVGITRKIFESRGYAVEDAVLNSADFGVAQTRSRHFLVASRVSAPKLKESIDIFSTDPISFDEACVPMPPLDEALSALEENGQLSAENVSRIEYLHENDLFNLPNKERPVCHQESHTYPSVYGRIRGDLPMTTITTGFGSPGRGRFIHPHERRVINIREAGRVQAFPDWYWEPAVQTGFKKAHFQKIIGDAVPPLFAYPLLTSLIAHEV
nr:DNA cytosine methyltransferase [Ruegeria arenilitoris]